MSEVIDKFTDELISRLPTFYTDVDDDVVPCMGREATNKNVICAM